MTTARALSPASAGMAEAWRGEFTLAGVRLPLGADNLGRILDANGDVVARVTEDARGDVDRAALARLICQGVNRAALLDGGGS
jgi:hypothetical protein